MPLDFGVSVIIFSITALMDIMHAIYTKAVLDNKPIIAATSGSVIYMMGAFAVLEYTKNWTYIFFMCAGSWIGTYTILKIKNNKR